MKRIEKIILWLILAVVLVLPLSCLILASMVTFTPPIFNGGEAMVLPVRISAQSFTGAGALFPGISALQSSDGDQFVLGGVYELSEGDILEGSLVVIGGVATLENGSRVKDDVVLLGGTLRSDGSIDGDVVSIGGLVDLGEHARIAGDVNILSGHLQRATGAHIEGQVINGLSGPLSIPVMIPTNQVIIPGVDGGSILWQALYLLFRSFLWAIVGLLVVLLLPNHSQRVLRAVVEKTGVATGLGMLTVVVAPLLLVLITITIIGIPVSLAGAFVLAVAWAFGVIVVGLEVGKRLVQAARQEWAPAVAAGLGVFLVTLVGNTIGIVVPCIGWILPALVGMLGLGAVLMTRFGTQDYLPGGTKPAETPSLTPSLTEVSVEASESTDEQ